MTSDRNRTDWEITSGEGYIEVDMKMDRESEGDLRNSQKRWMCKGQQAYTCQCALAFVWEWMCAAVCVGVSVCVSEGAGFPVNEGSGLHRNAPGETKTPDKYDKVASSQMPFQICGIQMLWLIKSVSRRVYQDIINEHVCIQVWVSILCLYISINVCKSLCTW